VNKHFNTKLDKSESEPKDPTLILAESKSEAQLLQITLTHMQEELKVLIQNTL